MLTIDDIKHRLKDHNLTAVSRSSGVGYMTLYRIMNVKDYNPSYEAIKKLSDYLQEK